MKQSAIFYAFRSALIFSSGVNTAPSHEIAITFDDLPGIRNESAQRLREDNQRILNALTQFKVPAIGFVTEKKLTKETPEKTALLQAWIDQGHTLGNHTYSHPSLHKTTLEKFEQNVLKGAIVSKQLMTAEGLPYRYFRHPFLHTGETPEKRDTLNKFLRKEGYVTAPVTIDTDDYKFNQLLVKHPDKKDRIIQLYLEHTEKKFDFYEAASHKLFGRNIKQVWLLHHCLLNAYAMESLLKLAQERGYTFVTLDKALEDPAYNEPDHYYNHFGVSWLYRWDFTRGKTIDWSRDPEPKVLEGSNFRDTP